MTARERNILRKAVRLLWQGTADGEDGFEQGMRLLLPLAQMRIPAIEIIDRAETVSIKELLKRKEESYGTDAPHDAE